MTLRRGPLAIFLLLGILITAAAAEGGTGEFTFVGTQTSGDYGSEATSNTQSTLLRFRIGNETQFFADLDWRRVRSDLQFFASPLGPIPSRRRGDSGPGPGPGPGPSQSPFGSNDPASSPTIAAQPTDPQLDGWNSGLGDLRLGLSQLLLGGGAKRFRLDAELGLKAPIADADKNLGTGEVDYRLGVAGNYRFWTMTGFAGIGWNSLGDPDWVELADAVDAFVGLETEPLHDTIVVSGWLEGNQEIVVGSGSRTALGMGIRSSGKLRWQTQIIAGLSGSAEDFSARAGVSFGVPTPAFGSDRIR